jgi:predicted nucleic acid-binding protein
MIVIADTSPINYLVLIDHIEVLPRLYGRVLIPPAVCEELQRARTPEVVRRWVADPPGWLEIVAPKQAPDSELIKADLDAGERDALLLAHELAADELIIDDMDGRREARRRGLPFIGTLGVLRLAGDRGLLDFKQAIAELRNTSFYIEPRLLDRLIRGEEI